MRSLRLILVLSLSLFSLSLPAAPDVKAVSEGDSILSGAPRSSPSRCCPLR